MPDTPRHPDPQKPASRPGEPWREEEKRRGAPTGAPHEAGAAGEPRNKGRPTDDRERTEGAAASLERDRPEGEGAARKPG